MAPKCRADAQQAQGRRARGQSGKASTVDDLRQEEWIHAVLVLAEQTSGWMAFLSVALLTRIISSSTRREKRKMKSCPFQKARVEQNHGPGAAQARTHTHFGFINLLSCCFAFLQCPKKKKWRPGGTDMSRAGCRCWRKPRQEDMADEERRGTAMQSTARPVPPKPGRTLAYTTTTSVS